MSETKTFQDFANEYPAMFKWCQRAYKDNPKGLAEYMLLAIASSGLECTFIDLFCLADNDILKAAELILTTKPKE